jgi:hypothetical protein
VGALIGITVLMVVALGERAAVSAWTPALGPPASYVAQADQGGGGDGPWQNTPYTG